jgi:hypothetical protein
MWVVRGGSDFGGEETVTALAWRTQDDGQTPPIVISPLLAGFLSQRWQN